MRKIQLTIIQNADNNNHINNIFVNSSFFFKNTLFYLLELKKILP